MMWVRFGQTMLVGSGYIDDDDAYILEGVVFPVLFFLIYHSFGRYNYIIDFSLQMYLNVPATNVS